MAQDFQEIILPGAPTVRRRRRIGRSTKHHGRFDASTIIDPDYDAMNAGHDDEPDVVAVDVPELSKLFDRRIRLSGRVPLGEGCCWIVEGH